VNITAMPIRRLDMVFTITKMDDIDKARGIIKSILDHDERILKDPEPDIIVVELVGDNVNLGVRPYVKTPDYSKVMYNTIEKIKLAFDSQLKVQQS
jgi:small conductance mechanosensitive channel